MRIGVNARRLAGQRLGVARYIEHLAKDWERMLDPAEDLIFFLREQLEPDDLPDRLEKQVLGSRLDGLLWENVVLPRAARSLDVLFCPGYTVPVTYRGRSVVAIHSINEVQKGTHPWWYHLTYSQIYRSSAKRADRVIVPSQSTLEDIQTHYRLPTEKLVVVPQGADETFQPIDDPEALRATRVRWLGDDHPYLLWVGKLSQRRNIPALLEGFANLKRRNGFPHKLLLMGPNHQNLPLDEITHRLGIADSVVQTDGRVSNHDELALVYNAADLYVNASAYEGFSLTLVEALACGTPVVGVRRAAVAEIADGCAVLVDEPTPEILADAMERALSDESLRQDLRARGLERARGYRVEETARKTLDVLRDVAAS
jgi:glycosyltransferase involved in cell wall biosynthesis